MIGPATQTPIAPVPLVEAGITAPENGELLKLVDDIVDATKYVLCTVAAEPEERHPSRSVEQSFSRALLGMKEDRRSRFQERARFLLDLDESVRAVAFGRYGSLPPDRVRKLGIKDIRQAVEALPLDRKLMGFSERKEGSAVNVDHLEDVWGHIRVAPSALLPWPQYPQENRYFADWHQDGDPNIAWPGHYRTTEFKIRQIHCVDETNPEWPGSDEILIGGTSIDPLGKVTKIGQKGPYTGFDDGNTEWFKPHMTFAKFENPAPKPGEYGYSHMSVFVVLAEQDEGGFGDFLNELYGHIQDEVKIAIMAYVTVATAPFLGPILAPIAGAAAAWAVDKLIKWFITWFQDDVFDTKHVTFSRPYPLALYLPPDWTYDGTGMTHKDQNLHFYGAGGHYKVTYYWRDSDFVKGAG